MALGLSTTLADSILNHLRGGTSWTAPSGLYVKLHTAAPGAAATTAAAGETTRQAATFGASSSGVIANTAALDWTSVSTSETYSHVSVWSASSGGTFLWSGALAAPVAVTAGGDFSIEIGDITATFALAT